MFYPTESKPQGWRAMAVFDDRSDRLLYLGRSSTQVRAGFQDGASEFVSGIGLSFGVWVGASCVGAGPFGVGIGP